MGPGLEQTGHFIQTMLYKWDSKNRHICVLLWMFYGNPNENIFDLGRMFCLLMIFFWSLKWNTYILENCHDVWKVFTLVVELLHGNNNSPFNSPSKRGKQNSVWETFFTQTLLISAKFSSLQSKSFIHVSFESARFIPTDYIYFGIHITDIFWHLNQPN